VLEAAADSFGRDILLQIDPDMLRLALASEAAYALG
jgi:hypothetical protein